MKGTRPKMTLVEYLISEAKYEVQGNKLIRNNGTIAATKINDKWRTQPTIEEMRDYQLDNGRGLPTMLTTDDPTNRGYLGITGQSEVRIIKSKSGLNTILTIKY